MVLTTPLGRLQHDSHLGGTRGVPVPLHDVSGVGGATRQPPISPQSLPVVIEASVPPSSEEGHLVHRNGVTIDGIDVVNPADTWQKRQRPGGGCKGDSPCARVKAVLDAVDERTRRFVNGALLAEHAPPRFGALLHAKLGARWGLVIAAVAALLACCVLCRVCCCIRRRCHCCRCGGGGSGAGRNGRASDTGEGMAYAQVTPSDDVDYMDEGDVEMLVEDAPQAESAADFVPVEGFGCV